MMDFNNLSTIIGCNRYEKEQVSYPFIALNGNDEKIVAWFSFKISGKDEGEATHNLVEEMADVLICMEQMQEMYGISDYELQIMVEKKCQRQEARLHESY